MASFADDVCSAATTETMPCFVAPAGAVAESNHFNVLLVSCGLRFITVFYVYGLSVYVTALMR